MRPRATCFLILTCVFFDVENPNSLVAPRSVGGYPRSSKHLVQVHDLIFPWSPTNTIQTLFAPAFFHQKRFTRSSTRFLTILFCCFAAAQDRTAHLRELLRDDALRRAAVMWVLGCGCSQAAAQGCRVRSSASCMTVAAQSEHCYTARALGDVLGGLACYEPGGKPSRAARRLERQLLCDSENPGLSKRIHHSAADSARRAVPRNFGALQRHGVPHASQRWPRSRTPRRRASPSTPRRPHRSSSG